MSASRIASTSLFPSTDGVDAVSTNYSKESIKALMKSRGVADQVGSYYDNVNARNNQIEEETTTQYAIATSIRQLESDLAELSPNEMSPQDILREQNKAAGEQLAKSYLDAIDGISGKNEHIHTYTQDEYVAIKQAENPALTREEILKDYVSGWKDAYKTELINEKNYNPECARIAAEKQSYNDKTVTVDDANGVSKVIYFVRDVGADAVTATAGLTSGTIDLGRNLKHVVAPDLVPTPLEYAEDAIAREYNDPNSQYYDPVKGAIFSTTRTIGHDAPIQVLKAIPQTKAIGETLDFLDKYGKKVNTNYQNNGGNFGAAHVKAAGDTAIDMAADAMTNSIPGASGFEKIASTAVGETFRDLGHNFLNTGDLEEAAQQTFNNAGKIFRTVATKNMPGDVSITGNKAIDTGLASIAREETGAFIDVAANGSTRAILDQGKILYNGVKTAVTTEAKEKSSEIAKQYNLRKEMESGTVYQAGENEYYYVSPAGKTMKIEDINKYKADETVSVKGVSSAAGSTASTVTSNANTMGGALSAHQTEKTEEVGYFDKEYEDIISSINNDSPDSTTQYGTGVVNSDTDSIFNVGNHDVTDMLGRESASNKPSMPDPGVIMFGGTSSGIESVGKMAGKITASDAFKRRTDENL